MPTSFTCYVRCAIIGRGSLRAQKVLCTRKEEHQDNVRQDRQDLDHRSEYARRFQIRVVNLDLLWSAKEQPQDDVEDGRVYAQDAKVNRGLE